MWIEKGLILIKELLYLCIFQGVITEDVVQLRKSIGAPGMAVLQFGTNYFMLIVLFQFRYSLAG